MEMTPTRTNTVPEQGPTPVPDCSGVQERADDLLRHFGFRESPFGVTPNPAFLFSSRMHLGALNSMVQSIESNLGFTVLLGNPGMGKTTLLLQLLTQYRDSARTAFIFQTQCKRYELLRYLASELELPMKRDEVSMHQRLKEMLVNEARAGRKVLIFIDEAQNLHHSSLEAIRLLSDFETPRAKLLHIILAGSAQLGDTLLTPELSQLAQRISTVCRLEPLAPEDVAGYVTFRLQVAGSRTSGSVFSEEALAEIAERSEGVPRVVNSICYRSLSLAYAIGERRVSGLLVRQAVRDLDLSHSGAVRASFAGPLAQREKPTGARVATDHISSPEHHGPLDSGQSRPELLDESAMQDRKQFRSPVIAPSNFVKQTPLSPESQQRGRTDFRPKAEHSSAVAFPGANRNFPRGGTYSGVLRIKRWSPDKDRSLLVILSLLLLGLALWAGWSALHSPRSSAKEEINPGSPENQSWAPLLSDVLYSPDEAPSLNLNPQSTGNNKPHAAAVQTLQQSLLPSRIRAEPANPTEAAPPVATSSTPGDLSKLGVTFATVPLPLPAPSDAERTRTSPSNDAAQTEKQAPVRQPLRVVQPKYPKLAELRRLEGDVLVELRIDSQGTVQSVRTIRGNPLFGEAAEQAAMQWQYPPLDRDSGLNFTVTRVRFNFTLHPENKR
jgi:TonB family protein